MFVITEHPPNDKPLSGPPISISVGPDKNLWFVEGKDNNIVRMTTEGDFIEFLVPTRDSNPIAITAGPDGNIWFTERVGNKIGRLKPH